MKNQEAMTYLHEVRGLIDLNIQSISLDYEGYVLNGQIRLYDPFSDYKVELLLKCISEFRYLLKSDHIPYTIEDAKYWELDKVYIFCFDPYRREKELLDEDNDVIQCAEIEIKVISRGKLKEQR